MDTMPAPDDFAPARPERRNVWAWLPLVLAVLWAVPSVMVGLDLIQDTPSAAVSLTASAPNLSSTSEELAYGGDAFTGIQNAAAETEKAVVDGFNQLGTFQLELQKSTAEQQARQAASSQARLEDGLGWILIALAVVNLTVAVGRLTAGRVVPT